MIETRPDSISTIAFFNRVSAPKLRRWYKHHLSGFDQWDQASHCLSYLLYPENFTAHMAIDEVALTNGEFFTIMTSRDRKGSKGKLAAFISGTKTSEIEDVLKRLPETARSRVKEVTLDMARPMAKSMANQFPNAQQVLDRFHVERMVQGALQHLRVDHRWKAIDQENEDILQAKNKGQKYHQPQHENGDTPKQLLSRSRGLLYKKPYQWSQSQKQRAQILFREYPDLQQAYACTIEFREVYELERRTDAVSAITRWITKWLGKMPHQFTAATRSILINLDRITAFFDHRSTNGNAESFNAQIKSMRLLQKGVNCEKSFVFRLHKLYS
ncbi:MAG: transposase [Bacteroidota bacterium]